MSAEAPSTASDPGDGAATDGELQASLRGSALLLAGRGIALVVEFAAQVMIVRYLTQEDFGEFAYALSIAYLLSGIIILGLPETLARYAPIYLERRQHWRLLGATILAVCLVVGIGLVAFALAAVFSDRVEDALESNEAAGLLAILILLAPLDGVNLIFQGLFAAVGRVGTIFVRQYVLVPGLRLLVAFLMIVGGKGAAFLAVGYVVVSFVGVLWYAGSAAPFLRRFVAGARRQVEVPAREILSFAIPVLLTNVFWIVQLAAGTIVLGILAGATEVAIFQAVLPPARLNYLVTAIFYVLFIPTISRMYARDDIPELRRAYMHTTYWLTTLTVPLLALTAVFAPVFVPTFFGLEYDDSIPVLILLSAGYYIHSTVGPNSTTLKVFRRLSVTVRIDLAALAFGIGLNLALIPPAGAVGAALAFLLAVVARNVAYQVALRRIAGITLFERDYLRLQLTVAAALSVLVAIQLLLEPGIAAAVLLSGLAGLAVLRACRGMLDIEGTFPELLRGPLRRILSG